MKPYRIALATLPWPTSPAESVALTTAAIADAGAQGVDAICFPECFVPGYRSVGSQAPPPDPAFLADAWQTIAAVAAAHHVVVVLGTERMVDGKLRATVLVINRDGSVAGFQDKTQVDPSEDPTYTPGTGRRVFVDGDVTFGVAICHEGYRYPETVRWPARHGAQIVFHPHVGEAEPGGFRPTTYGDPRNSFHEKAILCRAAENTCYVVTVNCAIDGSPTASAVARPDGSLQCYQPYNTAGLLIADLDLSTATRLLARRTRAADYA